MKSYLKQFTDWVIALRRRIRNNLFEKARLQLTLLYTGITMVIIVLFSGSLFFALEKNIRDVLGGVNDISMHAKYAIFQDNIHDVERSIVMIDIWLLFVVTALGYIIAGKVLEPIRQNASAQRRFLADVSHDLRTPLAIMKSESQVLLGGTTTDVKEYKKVIESNLEEIDKISRMVDDLLVIARTERLKNDNKKKIALTTLVEKLIKKMKVSAKQKDITVTLEPTTTATIEGDEQNIERVFTNILQNAIHYTKEKGSITIGITKDDSYVSVSIQDTGVGIKEEDLPHVFNRFYKAEHSRNDASGSGLGLSIAKQIVEQHRGTIHISSQIDVGTVVTIRLPLLV